MLLADVYPYPDVLLADVCAPVRGREPGPSRAHLEAAQGENPGDHRQLQPAVPGVLGEGQEEDQDIPQVMQKVGG